MSAQARRYSESGFSRVLLALLRSGTIPVAVMIQRLGTGLWRTALALVLLLASLVVYSAPQTNGPSLERFAVEICDAPTHDVPVLSRQETGDDKSTPTPKLTSRPPQVALEHRGVVLECSPPDFGEPLMLRSRSVENPTARGPPMA